MNELISNALKYGFVEGQTGMLKIGLNVSGAPGTVSLQCTDSGIGLPDDFEHRRQTSLGLQLIDDLTQQIGGTLHIGPLPSPTFRIEFTSDEPAHELST
jgi:two-component sensor histidine kinase